VSIGQKNLQGQDGRQPNLLFLAIEANTDEQYQVPAVSTALQSFIDCVRWQVVAIRQRKQPLFDHVPGV